MSTENNHEAPLKTLPQTFEAPRHWVGVEELSADYWNDSKELEKRGQEFLHKPIETLEALEKMDTTGTSRREFLTIMGASMALATTACVRRPVRKIIPYVIRPQEITPGISYYYASTYTDHTGSYGLLVKNREGRPIKLEGNPDHPFNRGKLSSRVQATILDLYDPDRIKYPLMVDRAAGSKKQSTWAEVDAKIQAQLKPGARVKILSQPIVSASTRKLVGEFLGSFKDAELVEYSPLNHDDIIEAQKVSYGAAVLPRYHFDKADYVLSLGADFLGAWVNPVEYAGAWNKKRKLDSKNPQSAKMTKLVSVESTLTITGANADQRWPVRAGDETKIALAILNELGKSSAMTAEKAAQEIGGAVTVAAIREIAAALKAHRGRSLVVAGGVQSQSESALTLQVAVNAINSALDNDGVTVDGAFDVMPAQNGTAALLKLVLEMKAGQVDVLILNRANLGYALPQSLGIAEALKKVPFVVSISEKIDETAGLADVVLADHHYLEAWGDAHPRASVMSLQQPAIAPLYDTRGLADSLITWIKGAKLSSGSHAAQFSTYYDYLRDYWKSQVHGKYGKGQSFEDFWDATLQKGVLEISGGSARARSLAGAAVTALVAPRSAAAAAGQNATLTVYEKATMGDGTQANNAWLQETPDAISTITWDNYVNMSPKMAERLHIGNHDVVEVSGDGFKFELPVNVQPGLHEDAISVAVGYGRTAVGNVGNGIGVNTFAFGKASANAIAYSGARVAVKKTGRRYELALTQIHFRTENRPVINDITVAQFKHSPKTANHTDPHLRLETVPTMWPKHEYKGYRWGMSIDLTACTGCGACITACQAENNVPVVGRKQVRLSREMHWIRIDRYYSGNADNPDVLFQPVMCQHCENAPCETVCPVLATVHDEEGVNQMVYARCVGTRYCANNCPYKVRRFNFFDYWKTYQEPMNLAYNPDVTVRMRGVMEKCSFCVQRIHEARGKAKDKKEKIKDGAIVTACQQTCPTDAIVFGDINDPESAVSKLHADGRAFRMLEILNTKPALSYLTKVRNKDGSTHGEHDLEGAGHEH